MANKTIIIGILLVLVVIGGAFLFWKNKVQAPLVVDTASLSAEESSISSLETSLASSAKDEAVSNELDQTLIDVAEETGAVSAVEAVNSASISQEESQIDFLSKNLTDFTNANAILQELNQAIDEVSQ